MNPRDPLPANILSLILDQLHPRELPKCPIINQWFYTAASPLMWRTITINTETRFTNFVTMLLTSPPERALAKHVKHLHIHVPMKGAHLLLLTKYLPLLKTLELGSAECQHFPHLTCLVLEKCRHLTPKNGAFGSLQACTSLRKLTLDIGAFAETYQRSTMTRTRMISDLLTLTSLTKLALLGCPQDFAITLLKYTNNTIATTNPTLTAAAGSCWPDLTEFSLDACRGVGDDYMMAFIQTHPKLTKLTLDNNDFTDVTLRQMAKFLPRLQSVSLADADKITAKGLRRFVLTCRTLTYLYIKGTEDIQIEDFREVDRSCFGTIKEIRGIVDDEPDSDNDYYDDYYDDYGRRDSFDDEDRELFLMHLDQRNIAKIRKTGKPRVRKQ
ncbi:unnamed protein product [Absidia cylindrospora]